MDRRWDKYGWKGEDGRGEEWKDGRWEDGRMEEWKGGRWNGGMVECVVEIILFISKEILDYKHETE